MKQLLIKWSALMLPISKKKKKVVGIKGYSIEAPLTYIGFVNIDG